MPMTYEPFFLRVSPLAAGVYPLEAEFQGAQWHGAMPADPPLLTPQESEQAAEWLARGFIDRPYLEDLGRRLFRALFPEPILTRFRQAYAAVADHGGLLIFLELPDELAGLPWELTYDADGPHGFLARSTSAPLVRHLPGDPLALDLPAQGPLRILVVAAAPRGYGRPDAKREVALIRRRLGAALGPLDILRLTIGHFRAGGSLAELAQRLRRRAQVRIEVLPNATRPALAHGLAEAQVQGRGYHVVHFIGHGEALAGGRLLLETAEGEADPIDADDFAELLGDAGVVLAVLNACETASALDLMGGVAQATLKRGVPAVLGMQVSVFDRHAVAFAHELYGFWAYGEPLEAAVARARRLVVDHHWGAAASWGIPVLYRRPVGDLTLPMSPQSLVARIPKIWAVRAIHSFLVWILAFFAAVGGLLEVPDIARGVRTQVPVVRCVWPYPMESGDRFNVVVAPITVLNADGSPGRSRDGREFARFLYGRLARSFADLGLDVAYELRGPRQTCALRGATQQEREASAQALAEDIGAHVVIYGVIENADAEPRFSPEFAVSYAGFQYGSELVGPHQFGRDLPIKPLPFSESDYQGQERLMALERIKALSLVTVGLACMTSDNLERAEFYFEQAEATQAWSLVDDSKALVYLMLGNVNARRADLLKNPEPLSTASAYYQQALDQQPGFLRAQGALAVMRYLQAMGDPQDLSWDAVDWGGISEAEAAMRAVLASAQDQGEELVGLRMYFYLGQLYLARASANWEGRREEWLAAAEAELRQITDRHEAGDEELAEWAGHTYAHLAMIASQRGDVDQAQALIDRAVARVAPSQAAEYHYRMATFYARADRDDEARAACARAIEQAEAWGQPQSAQRYLERCRSLGVAP